MNGTKLPICAHCRDAEGWCMRLLSRKLLRLVLVHENLSSSDDATLAIDPSTATGSDNYNCTYRVQIRERMPRIAYPLMVPNALWCPKEIIMTR